MSNEFFVSQPVGSQPDGLRLDPAVKNGPLGKENLEKCLEHLNFVEPQQINNAGQTVVSQLEKVSNTVNTVEATRKTQNPGEYQQIINKALYTALDTPTQSENRNNIGRPVSTT